MKKILKNIHNAKYCIPISLTFINKDTQKKSEERDGYSLLNIRDS